MGADNHRDRAFQYGDGLFTTLAVKYGKPQLWHWHKLRLQDDSRRLLLSLDIDTLQEEVFSQAKLLDTGVIKIHVSAGAGGRGYLRPSKPVPQVTLTTHEVPPFYSQWQQTGIDVDFSPVKLGHQPLLAGIKHLNRLEQVLIKQHIVNDDAIVCDMHDNLIEGSASNLFWYADGAWHTPLLTQCGVNGVFRAFLLTVFAQLNLPVCEAVYPRKKLLNADSVFLCNSLMQIVPIKTLFDASGNCTFSLERIKELQQKVATRLLDEHESLL
ncbi:aminodeoxychorismate lyase [Alteromonas sp. C1M14]|uniref:aminodeoxychorismate lyase n=1 Tax=Alteromonas sp. C1M14 TaxID=2841567 RepID=UPI001C0922DF|nr:aminodeoxychorismate lyase [Alteromonas sp. C1M14]MBU2976718.1 aminodeoxychorismate lyase [Alteromonas sp. C1M14]